MSSIARLSEILPASEQLLSAREVMEAIRAAHGAAGLDQANYLIDSGLLGETFSSSASSYVRKSLVLERLERPLLDAAAIWTLDSFVQHSTAVVLRMRSAIEDQDAEANGRPFYGVHRVLYDSADPDVARYTNEAIRKYWRFSSVRQREILDEVERSGSCPLIITVGKWCVGGRSIQDVHQITSGRESLTELDITEAGPWVRDLEGRWFDSGRGPSALVLHR